jgi:hypothetical protein
VFEHAQRLVVQVEVQDQQEAEHLQQLRDHRRVETALRVHRARQREPHLRADDLARRDQHRRHRRQHEAQCQADDQFAHGETPEPEQPARSRHGLVADPPEHAAQRDRQHQPQDHRVRLPAEQRHDGEERPGAADVQEQRGRVVGQQCWVHGDRQLPSP